VNVSVTEVSPAVTSAEILCLSCGLCCDGTLFAAVPLLPEEVDTSTRLSLRVLPKVDGGHVAQLPCSALHGLRCSVYTERPRTCRVYRCDLLSALDSDEVSVEEAQVMVRQVKDAASRLAQQIAPGDEGVAPLRTRAWAQHRSEQGQPLPEPALRELARMEELLRNHFRGRRGT
jgi:hypothetical protein